MTCVSREREREGTRLKIFMPMSFLGLTLASDLLAKALMKLSVSMFDILLPSQHLLFVFDAPKMAPHEAGVCASFPE